MKLPITDGESGPNMQRYHNVVHIDGYKVWPPKAGDKQGITYKSFFGRYLCKHKKTSTFFWVDYGVDRRSEITTRKGIVCRDCGEITWSYIS